mmetsp:Transcript_20783/g.23280  ORF Transcript_20783/g.23280 Transcript_20783/m.23280 type:complete len:410 (+) Transcript_20783:63-1292(+)|eukprot:CAMPEP_0195291682 /NCGR_PEP_ID=MMETSP0707-20130614/8047_1 /TAXON_ID=33640 /ORGANISM="Asterionellopsis glacialis, Strain CCMP134" /LENGTH=409 /DNA_ID=CAMNT_0040352021 /DNA_START=71 /DNA_END=1300 /DNA_ORIENTATION=+
MTNLTTMPHKDDEAFEIPNKWTKSGRKKAIPFPYKLMYVITRKEYSDMITWLPDGKSFRILLPSVFTSKVLPIHFKQAKYSSFKRKLHRWGFDRQRPETSAESNSPSWFGSDEAFCHENFQKNRFDLLELMVESKPMSQMNMKPAGPIIPKKRIVETEAQQPKPEESVATAKRLRRREEQAPNSPTARPVKRRATECEIRELEARISALAAAKQQQNGNKSITQTSNFNNALETRVRQCERHVAALNAANKRVSAPSSLSNNHSEAAIIRAAAVAAARAAQNSKAAVSRTTFPSFTPTTNNDAAIRAAALAAAANDPRPMMSGNTLNTLMEIEISRRVRERLTTIGLNRESSMISSLSSQIAAPSPSVDTRGIHWNTLRKATSPKLSIQRGSISLDDLPMTNIIMPRTA